MLAGLAAKIGWAPVHNWLPDAHSEAPPPVSALLSGALLPAVLVVAWRSQQALSPVVGAGTADGVLVAFGLVSLAVAVPFLWRPLGWKRLLAYSSLEHMGVIALGIGFATPLALAGVAVHIAGHAFAKALGFYAATPLLEHDPRAGGHAVTGVARTQPALGAAMGVSLGTLSGLPPSPLFVSEVLIVAGASRPAGPGPPPAPPCCSHSAFLGLAHALLESTVRDVTASRPLASRPGAASPYPRHRHRPSCLLLALSGAALWLPGTAIVDALLRCAVSPTRQPFGRVPRRGSHDCARSRLALRRGARRAGRWHVARAFRGRVAPRRGSVRPFESRGGHGR